MGDIESKTSEGIEAESLGGNVAITLGDGVVKGATGAILASSATGTELTLNAGSVLIGSIEIGGAGAAVLNTGPGLSIAHTFTGTLPTIGDVSGNFAYVNGNQIIVVDISDLAVADNQLSATLEGLSGVLATSQNHESGNWWLSGFGGLDSTPATGTSPEAMLFYGGLVAGTHALLENGVQLGVFAGASQGGNASSGIADSSNSYFAGLNSQFVTEFFSLDFAVTAGGTTIQGTRVVANNTVATGLETALSSHDSFFVAPEITLSSAPVDLDGFSFIPSIRIRYEAMQIGGFTETGMSDGGLAAGDALSQALNVRLQGVVPIEANTSATLVVRGGVDARYAMSSGNDITLLGVTTGGVGGGTEFSAGGFAGLDLTYEISDNAAFTANSEFRAGTSGFSASVSLGLKGEL